jgi:hypothetical protein
LPAGLGGQGTVATLPATGTPAVTSETHIKLALDGFSLKAHYGDGEEKRASPCAAAGNDGQGGRVWHVLLWSLALWTMATA